MARRFVYYIDKSNHYKKVSIDFKWEPGFALSQKQKSVDNLQNAFKNKFPNLKVIETSSASKSFLGKHASAFNLDMETTHGKYKVEQLFQAGKVYEEAGSQEKLLELKPWEAKKQIHRINDDDQLNSFILFNKVFPLTPKTLFYNWIYINALNQNRKIAKSILEYDAFTDIYDNPKRTINTQSEACSIYVSLFRRGVLNEALSDKNNFKRIVYEEN
ncbi:hypothetical protein WR164_01650 [Philodulcilactobacillus myokoensis]|uniref:Uncharacterized protein n=1 Tax=Philodulcilactobacillus myokoensis TaxID=2929573 RepID=A0A9W6B066_9LACO|nr:hypothetical protein [Philodulcilactobacillus myokoensis]GLB46186.1 hypothetical protein WR164_01650 [Philodulcilactobacillus myokoensis]